MKIRNPLKSIRCKVQQVIFSSSYSPFGSFCLLSCTLLQSVQRNICQLTQLSGIKLCQLNFPGFDNFKALTSVYVFCYPMRVKDIWLVCETVWRECILLQGLLKCSHNGV